LAVVPQSGVLVGDERRQPQCSWDMRWYHSGIVEADPENGNADIRPPASARARSNARRLCHFDIDLWRRWAKKF